MAKKRAYCAVYMNEINIFDSWPETQSFCKGKPNIQMQGFSTKRLAREWGESIVVTDEPDPEIEEFTPPDADREEVRRLFKLVATELREYGTSRPKVLALTFDKLSTEF